MTIPLSDEARRRADYRAQMNQLERQAHVWIRRNKQVDLAMAGIYLLHLAASVVAIHSRGRVRKPLYATLLLSAPVASAKFLTEYRLSGFLRELERLEPLLFPYLKCDAHDGMTAQRASPAR